jgi:hypothetical protein
MTRCDVAPALKYVTALSCASLSSLSLFVDSCFVSICHNLRSHADQPNNARDHDEVQQHASPVIVVLDSHCSYGLLPPSVDVLVDLIVRLLMPPIVKVGHLVTMLVLPRPIATTPIPVTLLRRLFLRFRLRTRVRVFGPLRAVASVAAAVVERRRRAAERAALLVQP